MRVRYLIIRACLGGNFAGPVDVDAISSEDPKLADPYLEALSSPLSLPSAEGFGNRATHCVTRSEI